MKRQRSESSSAGSEVESLRPTEVAGSPSPADSSDAAPAPPSPPANGGDAPARIGPYAVEKELGRGGMGRVFLAQQSQPVAREVAVKVLSSGGSSVSGAVARFQSEQQSLALVAHPNVAQIFDAGVTDDGLPYLVMEYVPGRDICSYARRHRLDLRARLRLFLPVCEAVQHAHRRGVIHRDLKPSNVLVYETGGKASPKVIDFGLAKLVDGDQNLTRADAMLGTPGYMSPEQIFGDATAVDTRTDVYSLGAVLYELLTDQTPFDVSRDHLARLFETVSSREPERPSRRVPRELASVLADDLDWVVLKALARDPDDRYGSPEALAEDLRAVLDGRTVSARRPTPAYRLRKWASRHRPAVIAGALSVAVALAALGWAVHSRWRHAQETRLAQRLGEEVVRFESLLRFAHTIPLHDLRPTQAEIRRRVEALESELSTAGPVAEGPLSYAVGRGRLALQEPTAARRVLDRAWGSGYRTPETALAMGEAMSQLYEREWESALAIRSDDQRQARLGQLDVEYRRPIVEWLEKGRGAATGSAELAAARLAFFEERYDAVLASVDRVLAEQPWLYEALILRAEVHRRRFDAARRRGDFESAADAQSDAREAYGKAAQLGESDPEALLGRCQLAVDSIIVDLRGETPVEDIEDVVAAGLDACRRAIEADPERSLSWTRLATLHRFWGFNIVRKRRDPDPMPVLDEAIAAATRALEIDPDNAEALLQLGRTHRELYRIQSIQREGEVAFDHLNAAVDALERAAELEPDRAAVANGVTMAFTDLARRAEAEGLDAGPFYERAEASERRSLELAPGHIQFYNFGILMRLRSRWELEQGRSPLPHLDRALEAYRQSIALNDNYPWADNNLAFGHMQRASWLLATGGDPAEDLDAAEVAMLRAESLRDGLINASSNIAIIHGYRGDWARIQGEDPEPHWRLALRRFNNAEIEVLSADVNIDPMLAVMESQVLASWAHYLLDAGDGIDQQLARLGACSEAAAGAGRESDALHIDLQRWLLETRRRVLAGDQGRARDAARRATAVAGPLLKATPKQQAPEILAARAWLWRARLAETDGDKLAHAEAGLAIFEPRPQLAGQALVEAELHLERACAGEVSALTSARERLGRAVTINGHLEGKAEDLRVRAGSATGC
ncbi:MAG: protein kinase [Acidobacteriota bacterium]